MRALVQYLVLRDRALDCEGRFAAAVRAPGISTQKPADLTLKSPWMDYKNDESTR
jgi:hypothetical protein